MPADVDRLPVSVTPAEGEALDGYLERLAAANGMDNPHLLTSLCRGGAASTFLPLRPDRHLARAVADQAMIEAAAVEAATLDSLSGIDLDGLDARERRTWRAVAARGWAPSRGSAICPSCLAEDGIWRIAWRHPWVTTCPVHRTWLVVACPGCGQRFRSHRTPLRTIDSVPGTCGNPMARRGASCRQSLAEIPCPPAPPEVLAVAGRIWGAVHGSEVEVLGEAVSAQAYLAEIKSLTVLLLHLAVQPGGDQLAEWAPAARADRDRSAGDHGARWGLSPPVDPELRGRAIAAADAILHKCAFDAAADALHPWTELTPPTNDGELGWLADHTTVSPTLTRLVMAATAQRRRLSALLADQHPIEPRFVPQVLPADLYAAHLGGHITVSDTTGRLFASLCLGKLGRPGCTWAQAAAVIGLDPATGTDAVRACTGEIVCGSTVFVDRLNELAALLAERRVDYRVREAAVRTLAARRRWYTKWARRHRPGAMATSRGYAVTFLWASYAHSTSRSSPSWARSPTPTELAYYRRYTARLNAEADARTALLALAANNLDTHDAHHRSETPCPTRPMTRASPSSGTGSPNHPPPPRRSKTSAESSTTSTTYASTT